MIESLFGMNLLATPLAMGVAFIIGILFGTCLEQAGFGSSKKLTSMFYFKDMSVFKVMFTAVITAMLGLQLLIAFGFFKESSIQLTPSFVGAQAIAGLIFGTGFAMGGWCPGTASIGLASGKLDALFFLLGAGGGALLFNELYDVITPLRIWGSVGTVHTYESLGVSRWIFTAIFTVVGIGMLIASEKAWPSKRT